ncbi:hypothetical protein [Novosphingobium pentaromativorans]|uniref:Uncharacterized protein n=1 Tax=Novosphingobium pentaromativorans US6-1 TaxID=1088721 RepID=G6E7J1_9SPHN|nr:hypothetical protein [Novosphingobium pentaromativorans]AIT81605.1 hypothetical protein JI59_18470 [Novosphingobium pentaromativorans US6-1]EHJ62814.1 hypothetical protein NSU_0326 [Novosphingobium pentaromativorans US6-1]
MAAGDVLENGSIDLDGRGFITSGRVIVSAEQAALAETKGWSVVGPDGDKVMIVKGESTAPVIRA